MKRFFMTLSICFLTIMLGHAQVRVEVDSNTVYKDVDGKVISAKEFEKCMQESSGKFRPEPTVIEDGKIKEFRLKKTSEADKKIMEEMKAKGDEFPKKWEGKKAPAFAAKDLNDKEISLSALKGKVVVLKFWFTACKPCIMEMPELNKLVDKYKDNKDVVFLAPCLDKEKEVINKLLAKHPFTYTSLYNAQNIADEYGVFAYPTHVIINKKGVVTYAKLSGDPASLEAAVENALSVK